MVGFRFPDTSKSETIPGLHLHGIADDRQSGGHLRSMVVDNVTTYLWIDELHPVHDDGPDGDTDHAGPVDFDRYEGPIDDPSDPR